MNRKQSIITGATSGIGKETAIGLANAGFDVLILARDQSKASLLVEELKQLQPKGKFQSIQCDFSSLKSVDAAAHVALDRLNQLDVLINNAGAIYQDRQESVDGIELTLAVNHLGPYHLTERLMPLMEQSKGTRIINVSSAAHAQAKLDWDDLQLKKGWSALKSYANTKLFNIYTARHWADKLRAKGITAYSLHPGVVKTGFAGNFTGFLKILLQLMQPFMITSKQGASTSIYLATDASVTDHSGKYFAKRRVAQPAEIAMNTSHQLRLIEESQKLIQQILQKMEDNNIDWRHFEKVAMHVGTILEAQEFPEARKPAYKLIIDFGPILGIKKSSAQITEQYELEDLVGKKVIAVTNFPPKQIGPFMSECLVLGTYSTGGVKLIAPEPTSENGDRIG